MGQSNCLLWSRNRWRWMAGKRTHSLKLQRDPGHYVLLPWNTSKMCFSGNRESHWRQKSLVEICLMQKLWSQFNISFLSNDQLDSNWGRKNLWVLVVIISRITNLKYHTDGCQSLLAIKIQTEYSIDGSKIHIAAWVFQIILVFPTCYPFR